MRYVTSVLLLVFCCFVAPRAAVLIVTSWGWGQKHSVAAPAPSPTAASPVPSVRTEVLDPWESPEMVQRSPR